MVRTHVFLGAPSSSLEEDVEESSSCDTSDWAHLDLRWLDRRLHPAPDYVGHKMSSVNKTILSLEDHSHLLSTEADGNQKPKPPTDVCSISILEYLDSCFPKTEQEELRTSTPLSYQTEYLRTWTLSQALVLRGTQRGIAAGASPVQTTSRTSPQTCSSNHSPPRTSPQACSRNPNPSRTSSQACSTNPSRTYPQACSSNPNTSRTSPQACSSNHSPSRTSPQACSSNPNPSRTSPPACSSNPNPSRTSPPACSSYSSSTPELFSPAPPTASLSHSAEFSSTRAEKDSVVLQATAEGLLCSQGEERDETPCSKKPRLSEDPRAKMSNVTSPGFGEVYPTTPLAQCVKLGVHYSVLVAVVHPCHLKEIKIRSGAYIPLALIIVTDQSGVEMKVALWRRAAFWALTVSPGDILFISELQLNENTWRGETVLRSAYNSKLLNQGQLALSAPQQVRAPALRPLCEFLRKHRPLLVSLPVPPAQRLSCLPYAITRSLRVNTLVHMLLRVTHAHVSKEWQSEPDSRCRSALQQRAVLSVEQPGGQRARLVLWEAAVGWLPRFFRDSMAVWDFHVLLVRECVTTALPEVHTTPWSSVQPLDPSDPRTRDFLQPLRVADSNSVELDLRTLLSQKYTGEVELRVQVESFHFNTTPLFCGSQLILDSAPLSPAPGPIMNCSSTVRDILKLLSGDVTYTGCGRCGAELETDSNGIYCPCYPCLPHTAVRCYYRPAVLTLSDCGNHQLCVQVPPTKLQNILKAPPDKLCKNSAPGSQMRHVHLAAERLHSLLALPKRTFTVTIQSHFLCDENSVPLSQEFTLLSLQFPA